MSGLQSEAERELVKLWRACAPKQVSTFGPVPLSYGKIADEERLGLLTSFIASSTSITHKDLSTSL